MSGRAWIFLVLGAVLMLGGWMVSSLIAPIEDRTSPVSTEGRLVFEQACAKCHGPRGEGKSGRPRLRGRGLAPEVVRGMVVRGKRAMPRFPNIREEALSNLARYVSRLPE